MHDISPEILKDFFKSAKAEEFGRTKEAVETVKNTILTLETRVNRLEVMQTDMSVYIKIIFAMLAGLSGYMFKNIIIKIMQGGSAI